MMCVVLIVIVVCVDDVDVGVCVKEMWVNVWVNVKVVMCEMVCVYVWMVVIVLEVMWMYVEEYCGWYKGVSDWERDVFEVEMLEFIREC